MALPQAMTERRRPFPMADIRETRLAGDRTRLGLHPFGQQDRLAEAGRGDERNKARLSRRIEAADQSRAGQMRRAGRDSIEAGLDLAGCAHDWGTGHRTRPGYHTGDPAALTATGGAVGALYITITPPRGHAKGGPEPTH